MRSLFHSCAVAAQFFWFLPLISAVTASATGLRSASRKNTLTFAAFDQSAFAHLSVTVSSSSAASLAAYQQMLATDKLLEYAEISLRTLCDLIRYQQLKEFGIVHSAKEFIQLFHPDEQEDTP